MVGEENQHELVWVFSQVVLNEMVWNKLYGQVSMHGCE